MMKIQHLALVATLLVVAAHATAVAAGEDTVTIADGALKGVVTDTHRAFLGVPFAAPPVGDLRWAPPAAVKKWDGVLDASAFAPGCPQDCQLPKLTCPSKTDEDCLYLNVYTPRAAALDTPAPVVLFFPGGRFEQGGAATLLYDSGVPVNVSTTIIVTADYRLGALGWVRTEGGIEGNFGFMDQVQALHWVQANIAAFGGDAKRVTIQGQSAGSTSVAAHLVSPASSGLFAGAIGESNPMTIRFKLPSEAEEIGKGFAKDLGCDTDDMACFRAKTPDEIVAATTKSENKIILSDPLGVFLPWTPILDQKLLFQQPFDAVKAGKWNHVPTILGTVKNESKIFIYEALQKKMSDAEYVGVLGAIFGLDAGKVLHMFPPHSVWESGDNRDRMCNLGTPFIFACPNRHIANLMLPMQDNVFLYHFDHPLSMLSVWGERYAMCQEPGVVCHASELPFVFNSVDAAGLKWAPDEVELAQQMVVAWTNFAHTGNPNKGPNTLKTAWPAWSAAKHHYVWDVQQSVDTDYYGAACDLFDSIGYYAQ